MKNFEEKHPDEYFKDNDFFTPNEAAFRWKLKRNTVIAALNRGRFNDFIQNGLVKRFTLKGSPDWYISATAMRAVFGEEDKVQVFELWNRIDDESKPKQSICFNGRNIYTTQIDEDVPIEVLENMRKCDNYRDARRIVQEYLCAKEGKDYVINIEIVELENKLVVNYTDFFVAHRINDENHRAEVKSILNKMRSYLELNKNVEFTRLSTDLLSKNVITIQMGVITSIAELNDFEKEYS
ncbi:hypothetical protein [Paenibacillus cucumis (ex Kampfer et al. 2016)]|uniref:Uncharacterized protein n=1 Tax=Paenibacillus cucumis (ex Kampfer et al. 2016) TaxID=1776858 RepID=A0ABS7KE78_9BACL|nr:hypothetical protein [Paenibacillus cucumis (ex Kampfer et al. 2016)]MBY0202449.1 hypothetical protein [Paenibacillus cucumis (ex Kampfer et al. 2016)]